MRRLKAWSGMTHRDLERRAAAAGDVLPRSTLAAALRRDSLPREELLTAFVRACGCGRDRTGEWLAVRARLAMAVHADGDVPEPPPDRLEAPRSEPGPRGSVRRRRWMAVPVLVALCTAGGASVAPPEPSVPAKAPAFPRPAGWWRFEEGGGKLALDSSGHGGDARIAGGAKRVTVPSGHALQLDGTGHAATAGPVIATDRAFAITAWVRLDAADDWGTAVSQHGGAYDVLLLNYDPDKAKWAIMIPGRATGWALGDETVYGATSPRQGTWSHLGAVYDPSAQQLRLYVDGDLIATRHRTSMARANGPLDMGRALERGKALDSWHGAIDDVRVFDQALTRPQIQYVMTTRS
jgi:hypothetical protein